MPPDRTGFVGVGSWIERRARVAPADVAVIADERPITYAELALRIRSLANGLRSLGVRRGDRVAWVGPNHPAFLEALFASGLLGAALAPVNHRLTPEEIRDVLGDIEPAALIVHAAATHQVGDISYPRVVVGAARGSDVAFEELVDGSSDEPIAETIEPDDVALLPHTSGTTGRPKGVMLTHANVTWNVVNFLTVADFRADDVTIAIAPFFRVGGTGVNVLPTLFVGGTVVVPSDTRPDALLASIRRHRVSVGFGNPDALDALCGSPAWPAADLSSIRFVLTGGAPVPERLIRAYLERGIPLLQGYGLSEAGPLALLLDPRGALDRVGSAGTPPLFVDVRVVRADGADAEPNETGELLVRGPNVMAGYWRLPDDTRRAIVDGWLHTGDAARLDDDGFAWIVGRVRDAVIVGGRTIHPGEIERVLTAHPDVADGAVAASGKRSGSEGLVALVVPAAGADLDASALMRFCRERLRPHEVPASVVFVDELPRNSVGKLDRVRLRALASDAMVMSVPDPRPS
ncbi:MAG: AMP-binding protein [Actinomycetota bacterium]